MLPGKLAHVFGPTSLSLNVGRQGSRRSALPHEPTNPEEFERSSLFAREAVGRAWTRPANRLSALTNASVSNPALRLQRDEVAAAARTDEHGN